MCKVLRNLLSVLISALNATPAILQGAPYSYGDIPTDSAV